MPLPKLGEEDDVLSPEALEFLEDALRAPMPSGFDLLAVTLPAPSEASEKFLRLVPRSMGVLWRSPSGNQFAGGGAAHQVSVQGEDRFTKLSKIAGTVFPRILSRTFGDATHVPVLVGGAAFAPGVPPFEPWEEFQEDAFTLPRWAYRRARGNAWLTVTMSRDEVEEDDSVARIIDEIRVLLRALDYESATSLIERFDIPPSAVHHLPQLDWTAYIDAIHAAIRSGEYEKIVAARQCVVELRRRVEDTGFMARVFAAYPDCTHFAIRREKSTFLGATPETLFRKTGLDLTTHALAGTTRVKDDPREDSSRDVAALQSSRKDLVEHDLVVQRIRKELEPLSTSVTHANAPEARQVRNLIHLQTPISAKLKPTTTAFDLLKALHPTPAVGGQPAREAAQWLRYNEPLERGWYTGVVGWFDARGDAEFAVAIRCGVLTERRAYIFAGAGVVAASTADAEYAETSGKMTPVLRALGVLT